MGLDFARISGQEKYGKAGLVMGVVGQNGPCLSGFLICKRSRSSQGHFRAFEQIQQIDRFLWCSSETEVLLRDISLDG